MANSFRISSEKVKDQLAVVITDASTYDNVQASYFAPALFYSKDEFVANAAVNFSAPGDAYNIGPWTIADLDSQATYAFHSFWVEKFRAYPAQPIQEGSIVWWENQFYAKITAGSTNSDAVDPPDENSTDFALLDIGVTVAFATLSQLDLSNATALDLYEMFDAAIGGDGVVPGGNTITSTTLDEPFFTVVKQSCYSYLITKLSTGIWTLQVYALPDFVNDGSPLIDVSLASASSYLVTLPEEDAVYVVKIIFDDTVHNVSYMEYYSIYEYCELEACFQTLLKDILCNETVCDPSEDCNNDNMLSTEGLKRTEIMKIGALYFEMMMLIHAEQMQYMYKYTMTDDRESRLTRASDLMTRINEVLTHCDICGSGTVGSSGCENC